MATIAPVAELPLAPAKRSRNLNGFDAIIRRIAIRVGRSIPRHIAVEDLVSSGWVGLLEVADRASSAMSDAEFEAYARVRIRGAMLDYLRQLDPAGRRLRATIRQRNRAEHTLTAGLRRAPARAEISEALGVSASRAAKLDTLVARVEMASYASNDNDVLDGVASNSRATDDAIAEAQMKSVVSNAIGTLPERQRDVLRMYYEEERTLREIGDLFGVTESRVCQIHSDAVRRLRAALPE